MSDTMHPAVGEAAQILLKARGQEFSHAVKIVFDALLPATKERNAGLCWVLCDELWQINEFREWAAKNGIPLRSPKPPRVKV